MNVCHLSQLREGVPARNPAASKSSSWIANNYRLHKLEVVQYDILIKWMMHMKEIICELRIWNQMKNDPRSYDRNFYNCVKEAWKSYPQFTYDFFHMHHSFTYLSREHMNPKLTCSQRQWLHSSVGRASHRYREVTGSSPVEVLNFFHASLRNCKNCDHNCEDHSSFDDILRRYTWNDRWF